MQGTETESRRRLLSELVRTASAFQRRNQFIDRAFDSPFSVTEGHILIEIEAAPRIRFQALQSIVRLPKATLSQAVQKLVTAGIVSKERREDRRSSSLTLTKQGKNELKKYHRQGNDLLNTFLSAFAADEIEDLTNAFRVFGDNLGAAPLTLPPPALRLRAEVGRVTRGLGLLSRGGLLATDYSPVEWHVLGLLENASIALTPTIVASKLRLQKSTLSVVLAAMKKRGLIERTANPHDGRGHHIRITSIGRKGLEEIEAHARAIFDAGLSTFSLSELERFASLFRRLAGLENSQSNSESQCATVRITDATLLPRLRGFLVEQMAKSEARYCLPQTLFAEEGWSYAFSLQGEFFACVEFRQVGPDWKLGALSYKNELPGSELLRFVTEALAHFFSVSGVSRVTLDQGAILVAPELLSYANRGTFSFSPMEGFPRMQ